MLRLDVDRLKEDLAAANAKLVRMPVVSSGRTALDAVGVTGRVGKVTRPTTAEAYAARERKPNVERECGGPGRCHKAAHGAYGHPGY